MPKLIVSIPELGLSPKADDSRDIYVLAFASDLNIKQNSETEIIGGANKSLPAMVGGLADKDAFKFMLASVSNIFHVTRSFPKASLSGSGIMIYSDLDPNGFFALQLFVIESDDNHRRFADKLKKVLDDKHVSSAVDRLKTSAAVTSPLLGSLMGAVTTVIPQFFRDSADDLLFSHSHSGFDFDNYGLDDGQTVRDFPLAGKLIEGKLRVRVRL
ncbi:MAG: hypothetical protein ACK4S4_05550 [Pyrinomonadaceae bacterium]